MKHEEMTEWHTPTPTKIKQENVRIVLAIHPEMLKLFDEYCKKRYMNRTEGMRSAIRKMVIKND